MEIEKVTAHTLSKTDPVPGWVTILAKKSINSILEDSPVDGAFEMAAAAKRESRKEITSSTVAAEGRGEGVMGQFLSGGQ